MKGMYTLFHMQVKSSFINYSFHFFLVVENGRHPYISLYYLWYIHTKDKLMMKGTYTLFHDASCLQITLSVSF